MSAKIFASIQLLILFGAAGLAAQEKEGRVVPGEVRVLAMKPGESRDVEYVFSNDVLTSVWVISRSLGLTLDVVGDAGQVLIRVPDVQEGRTLWLDGAKGARIVLRLSAPAADAPDLEEADEPGSRVEISVVESPSTQEDAVLALEIRELTAAAVAALEAADRPEALRLAEEACARTEGVELRGRDVHGALHSLALLLRRLERYETARTLLEKVVSFREATSPPQGPELIEVRWHLYFTLVDLDDGQACRAFGEKVLAQYRRVLPEEHPELLDLRTTHAATLAWVGEFEASKREYEELLRIREPLLEDDDPELLDLRGSHASVLRDLGDLEAAIVAMRGVLDAVQRGKHFDEPTLLGQIRDFGITLLAEARKEEALEFQERLFRFLAANLPEEHPQLQESRIALAVVLGELEELERQKELMEQVLRFSEATLPPGDSRLRHQRATYANILLDLEDFDGARALFERLVRQDEISLPPDSEARLTARGGYAVTLYKLGEFRRAREIFEELIEVAQKAFPRDAQVLQTLRINYANVLWKLGEGDAARALDREVLEVYERTLPPGNPNLEGVRMNAATNLLLAEDFEEGRELLLASLERLEQALPPEHGGLHRCRTNYALALWISLQRGEDADLRAQAYEFVERFVEQTLRVIRSDRRALSSRQMAGDVALRTDALDAALSLDPEADGPMAAACFELVEALRSAEFRVHRFRSLVRGAEGESRERLEDSRRKLEDARRQLESFIARPDLSDEDAASESVATRLARLVRNKEVQERAFDDVLRELPGSARILADPTLEDLARVLPEGAVAVSFWRFKRWGRTLSSRLKDGLVDDGHLAAFVLDGAGTVRLVPLGENVAVKKAIAAWREAIESPVTRGIDVKDRRSAADEAGSAVRKLVIDPVLAELPEGTRRLVVALSDDLHLLTLDALPLEDGRTLGDAYTVEAVTSLETVARDLPFVPNPRRIVALGDVDYLGRVKAPSEEEAEIFAGLPAGGGGGLPSWRRDLAELPFSAVEIQAIAKTFERAFDDDEEGAVPYEEPILLRGRRADSLRLRAYAPTARFLHLATHGWFAPDSIPSVHDEREGDAALGLRAADFRDQVKRFSPLSLCGLALTGANLPPREDGLHPGLLGGTEIAALDLSGVELAVLSACETNVGSKRPGQGIASLQQALSLAGVRHSVTSLWKVPDEATQKLMARFYEGIWRRGESKREALWNAKLMIRNETDPRTGAPRYGLRDWAGWMLVGHPE